MPSPLPPHATSRRPLTIEKRLNRLPLTVPVIKRYQTVENEQQLPNKSYTTTSSSDEIKFSDGSWTRCVNNIHYIDRYYSVHLVVLAILVTQKLESILFSQSKMICRIFRWPRSDWLNVKSFVLRFSLKYCSRFNKFILAID